MIENELAVRILHVTRNVYRGVSVAPTSTANSLVTDGWPLLQKVFDVAVGLLSIYLIKLKWDQYRGNSSQTLYFAKKMQVKQERLEKALHDIKVKDQVIKQYREEAHKLKLHKAICDATHT